MSNEGTAFVHQTTIDSIVTLALDAIDKPEEISAPEQALTGAMERWGPEVIEGALARCRELLAVNPRDFVALGAVQLLEHTLIRT